MQKGKSKFEFIVGDVNKAVQDINQFLTMNKYKEYNSNGTVYYMFNDIWMMGKVSLEYYVEGNKVTVLAYLRTPDKALMLDDSIVGAMGKQAYLSKLQPLFNALSNNKGDADAVQNDVRPTYQEETMSTTHATQNNKTVGAGTNDMVEQMRKSKNKFAFIAFGVSIVSLLMMLCGVMLNVFILAFAFYFAYVGLSSEKKGFSIAAFVMLGLTVAIFLFFVMIGLML